MEYFEAIFSVMYIIVIIYFGVLIYRKSTNREMKMFGIMALVLGFGDSFHVLSRSYAIFTDTMEVDSMIQVMGFGRLATSITMTFFYLIFYYIYKMRFRIKNTLVIDSMIWILVVSRIVLVAFPQNEWFAANPSYMWSLIRNAPFTLLGIILMILLFTKSLRENDKYFKYIAISVFLSFAFYAPVILWVDVYPLIGMLMIPKTLAYVSVVYLGYKVYREV